jgi:hypothetical protein
MRSSLPKQKYFVLNGVRRALASLRDGLDTVPAILYQDGLPPQAFDVPLDQLHVPATKAAVPLDHRLLRIVPPILTPIEIEPINLRGQSRSVPLASVRLT